MTINKKQEYLRAVSGCLLGNDLKGGFGEHAATTSAWVDFKKESHGAAG